MRRYIFSIFVSLFFISCADNVINPHTGDEISYELFEIAKQADPMELKSYLAENPYTINGQDPENGNTALTYVILVGYMNNPGGVVDCVDILLAYGADPNIRNNLGEIAIMDAAIAAGNYIDPACNPEDTVYAQVANRLLAKKDTISEKEGVLLSRVNTKDRRGDTALHHSVTKGTLAQAAITKSLGIKMQEVDEKDLFNKTPLDIAVTSSHQTQAKAYHEIFRTLCARTNHNPYETEPECKDLMPKDSIPSLEIVDLLYKPDISKNIDVFEELVKYVNRRPDTINGFDELDVYGLLPACIKGLQSSDNNNVRNPLKNILFLLDAGATIDQEFIRDHLMDTSIIFAYNSVTYFLLDVIKLSENIDPIYLEDYNQILDVLKILLKEYSKNQINSSGEIYDGYEYRYETLLSGISIANTEISYQAFLLLIKDPRLDFDVHVGRTTNQKVALDIFLEYDKQDDDLHYKDKLQLLCQNTAIETSQKHTECEPFI